MPKAELTKEEIKDLTKDDFDSTPEKDPVKRFLLMTQKGPKGSVLDVKPLWDSFYRLNFWKHERSDCLMPKSEMVESRFVRVDKKGKKYTVKDLTRKQNASRN